MGVWVEVDMWVMRKYVPAPTRFLDLIVHVAMALELLREGAYDSCVLSVEKAISNVYFGFGSYGS